MEGNSFWFILWNADEADLNELSRIFFFCFALSHAMIVLLSEVEGRPRKSTISPDRF